MTPLVKEEGFLKLPIAVVGSLRAFAEFCRMLGYHGSSMQCITLKNLCLYHVYKDRHIAGNNFIDIILLHDYQTIDGLHMDRLKSSVRSLDQFVKG